MAAVTAAVVGIASAGASTYMSFSNAAKQKRAQEEADREAKKAMKDARSRAEKDYFEGLNVPLDAYEAEFEQNLAVAKQSTEALQEGDARALAAGVGRVGATAAQQNEDTRIAMGEEISDLRATKAQSKDAINQQLMEMDVAYAREQNQRSNEAEAKRAQAIQQGIQGIGSTVTAVAGAAPLFKKQGAPAPPSGGGGIGSGSPLNPNMIGGSNYNYTPPSLSLNPPSSGSGLSSFSSNSSLFGSDRKLKTNISKIGKSPSGLNIYSFNYKNHEGLYQGVMSDEIPSEAVVRVGSYDMVNYAMIDVEFKQL